MQRLKTIALGAALSVAFAGMALAGDYPRQPITLIVPAAAGGSTDLGARVVAEVLGRQLGTTVVVENKGGGGGRIGAAYVAKARPDGYTLLYGNSITNALLPAAAKRLEYDALKDFEPIAQIFWYSTLIVCNPSLPFNDLAGMIAYGKKHPQQLTIATAGVGSGNHFSSELLGAMAGIQQLHIPYRGNAPAVQDVVGGRASCIHMTEAKPYLDSGRLKAIATTGLKRDTRFAQVPTVDESGLKGYDMTWWQGVFAPAGTPPEVIRKLTEAAEAAAADSMIDKRIEGSGFVTAYEGPEDLKEVIRGNIAKFKKIATDAQVEIE